MSGLIAKVEEFVKAELDGYDDSHNFAHVNRVRNTALDIANYTNDYIDRLVIEIAALVHDVGDPKYSHSDTAGPEKVREFLIGHGDLTAEQINKIVLIVENIGWSKNIDPNKERVMFSELAIVQDADRLDAIGMIGVTRCITYGATHSTPFFNPDLPPKILMTKEEYRESIGTSVNHFFEKLLKIKDHMNTHRGRQLAQYRHGLMVLFLREIFREWGTDMEEWHDRLDQYAN